MDKRIRRSPVLLLLVVFGWLPCILLRTAGAWAAAEPEKLDVARESGGGVRATAHVLFPAPPAVVHALLTDYPHWPDLFEVRMRVAELNIRDGVATVDLRIDHPLMPGERRLITESRTLPSGGLVTELKGGDFKRYHRVWRLEPADEGNQTGADFELVVEIESLVPDWMVAIAMRQELEAHFRIVKQKAFEHFKR